MADNHLIAEIITNDIKDLQFRCKIPKAHPKTFLVGQKNAHFSSGCIVYMLLDTAKTKRIRDCFKQAVTGLS